MVQRKDKYRQNHSIKLWPRNRTWLEEAGALNKTTGKSTQNKNYPSLNELANVALWELHQRQCSDQALLTFLDTRKAQLVSELAAIRTQLENLCAYREQVADQRKQKKLNAAATQRKLVRLGYPTTQQLKKVKAARATATQPVKLENL